VPALLDDALGPLVDELGHPDVVLRRLVEGAGDDLDPLDLLAEVGDLLGPLVDEEDDDLDVGLVLHHRLGDLFKEGGLTRLGRGDDQPALAAADGGEQVDDPGGELVGVGLELDLFVRELGDELVELGALFRRLRVHAVYRLDPDQGAVALVVPRRPRPAHDVVAAPQGELLDEPGGDDDASRIEVLPGGSRSRRG